MEEEDNIIVKWAKENVETSYNLLNNNNNNNNNTGNTTTCFGRICGPSSGCNLDLDISYTRYVCEGGTRSRYFNIGCHDLGFVIM